MTLQNNRSRDFPASDGGDQLVKVGYLPDVGELVQYQTHMDGKPPAVHVVGPVAQQIDKLALQHRQNEIECRVRVRHDKEQCRFAVAQGVQLHFVGFHQLTDFPDVKGR